MFKGGIVYALGEQSLQPYAEAGSMDSLSDRELDSLLAYYEQRIESNLADLKDYDLYVAGQRERLRRQVTAPRCI